MNDGDSFAVEFELSPSGVSDVKGGRPPGRGSVKIRTSNGAEQYCLELFTYSLEQSLEAVSKILRGGCGGISTEDTTYIVFESEKENRGHVTLCFSRDAVTDPNRRLLPRSERPLDTVVPLPVLVDEVLTAVGDLLEQIERINEDSQEYEWYRELNAELNESRSLANDLLQ